MSRTTGKRRSDAAAGSDSEREEGPTAISVQEVTKRYGSLTAVDRVSFTVEEGETFGFLGHNGAGKSTTINMLLDFAQPTSGTIEVFGKDCRSESVAAREHMGVLPEGYDVYDELTGRQHVELAMESKGVNGEPMDFLDRVGITDAANRNAGGYSKGMAQRMVLAMALVGEPDLLVLDEPTSGLDPSGARSIREIIAEENARGATVFFSSHILEQVEAVCDRVGIMDHGELVAVDTIKNLRETVEGGTKLLVTVGEPGSHAETIGAVEGVESVRYDDEAGRFEVTCATDAKLDVLLALDEAGVTVHDFTTEEASLEDLFVRYTGSDDE